MASLNLSTVEVDRLRQWFNALQDISPKYFEHENRVLAGRIFEHLETSGRTNLPRPR